MEQLLYKNNNEIFKELSKLMCIIQIIPYNFNLIHEKDSVWKCIIRDTYGTEIFKADGSLDFIIEKTMIFIKKL